MMLATTDNMIWQFLLPHIKYLQEQGNAVECVCARTGFWFEELKEKHGLTMHEIDFGRNPISIKNMKAHKKLVKLQEFENFDLIYCQQPVGGMMGRLIAKKFKVPCIYTAHGFHFYEGCPLVNKLVYKTVEKWLSKYTDVLVAINEEDYQAALKMKAKRVFKINGIGIDDQKMQTEDFDKLAFKKSFNLNEDDKVILTISEMNWNKNYTIMLQAIKILTEKNPKIKFISCGSGEWAQKIRDEAKEMGIENNCLFLGFRKDIAKILQITDVFLHASHREGLTLSVMEAMSVGLPCVVSNVRGNRDLIDEGEGGFLVDCEDANSFAEKIEILLTNEEMSEKFGQYNKEKSAQYTVETVKAQLAEIYKEL